MMRVLLESVGAKVTPVSPVAAALERLENSHFDILISDVEMPDEDGYSLIKRIRRADNAQYSEIGAIALTAHARTADRLRALSAGFDSHVAKPFEPAELLTVIAGLARRTKLG
ncbi:MAG TPA: response regulator, partial [Pyrinomonadaceae bacterium]|nr:response regulator [Pyrinomonadaceae bacterium]